MIIIGVDFHPAHEEIASVDTDTGEYQEKRSAHPQEAEEFYRSLASLGKAVRVGIDDLPLDWSRDGHNLLYLEPPDLWVYSFVESKSHSLLKATASLNYAQFSPDSKWVAYSSNESGRWEVYVTSFPDARGKWQLSTDGGEQPRWRGDGKEIYFLSSDAKLMAVSVDTKNEFESGTPTVLFQAEPREQVATTEQVVYDVSRDGQRFLVNSRYNNSSAHPMSVILNLKLR